MYPDKRLHFLSKQSCSNFYKLALDLKHHQCCLALGAGASATVGLPTWPHLLKRICYCYFEEWALKVSSGKATTDSPPSNISIALTQGYELYVLKKEYPDMVENIENAFATAEYWINGSKLSDNEAKKETERMQRGFRFIQQLQDRFMEKIMSGDLTIIAQMIKNQVRPRDWNYLVRKALYSSYEDAPYIFQVSTLYQELIYLVKKHDVTKIINYNYDDTFYHALKENGLRFKNCYENAKVAGEMRIFYPHGFIPMKGGVITQIVLCEEDYQNQIFEQNLWSNGIQSSVLSSSTCIFIGLSLNDSNIRRLISMCSAARYYIHYAFLPSSGQDQASKMYDSLCDGDLYRLGIRVIRYPSENNHIELSTLINCLCNMS